MTRIIAGAARGQRLATPRGEATRPTADRVREAVFSALESALGEWPGVRFLDLYAGSGGVGLEALSRGAAHATLVERDRKVAAMARDNAGRLGLAGAHVLTTAVERLLHGSPEDGQGYDVVFLDPPYTLTDDALYEILTLLVGHGWTRPAALLVVERATRDGEPTWPEGMHRDRVKKYGETAIWYVHAT